VLSIAAIAAAGFYLNHKMKISKLNDKLQSALGKDQGITETIIKVEKESGSMSFKELFELCDKAVKDRTDMLIELRGLYPELRSTFKDSLIEFLNAENELTRSKSQSYRKFLDVSSEEESYKRLVDDYVSSSYDMGSYYRRDICDKCNEIIKDADEMKSDVETYYVNYNLLIAKEISLDSIRKKEGLVFSPIFSKYGESNLKYLNSTLDFGNSASNKATETLGILNKRS